MSLSKPYYLSSLSKFFVITAFCASLIGSWLVFVHLTEMTKWSEENIASQHEDIIRYLCLGFPSAIILLVCFIITHKSIYEFPEGAIVCAGLAWLVLMYVLIAFARY